jgi:calcineurin-like phosphoesterase family protein/nucleoside 2-deoxyribosyltransferase
MIKRFFTSDQHFGDDRFNLFYRPFTSVEEQNEELIERWNSVVKPDDIVYHLGDFAFTDDALEIVKRLNGEIHLIKGNYDDPRPHERLEELFTSVSESMLCVLKNGVTVYLNHYPMNAEDDMFNIVGHIHGLWKVQRNMINVSCDAWHFYPVSEDQIIFAMNAINKFYDMNVFAGEIEANKNQSGILEVYAEEQTNSADFKIFLAGPTPRDKHTRSWRPLMLNSLRTAGFKGTVYIPEKRKKSDSYNYIEQVEWEEWALDNADLIVFWVPRDLEKMPGFTTNVEFGEWMHSGKVVLGYPEDAANMKYLRYKAEKNNIPTFNNIDSLAQYIKEYGEANS